VTLVSLLNVSSRTVCGSSLLDESSPPQPAIAAGIGSAKAQTMSAVRIRVKVVFSYLG
jgi:hypothetical protein